MDAIHRFEIKVTGEVLDANGHVNNVAYVHWMQDAAIHHSAAAGCTALTLDLGATWVARSHHVEYRKPGFSGDTLTVLTWVANFRKVSSLRRYRFIRGRDQALLVEAQTEWILIDARTGRPRAIPEAIRNVFAIPSLDQGF